MIKIISKKALKSFEKTSGAELLTVYIPLQTGPQGTKRNISMLHSVYADLKEKLPKNFRYKVIADLEKIENELEYSGGHPGLAIFADRTTTHIYSLFFTPKKQLKISSKFDLDPIVRQYHENQPYYVLTISQNGSHLYVADRFSLEKKRVKGLDKNLQETLRIDEIQTNNLQTHSIGMGGKQNSTGFHGHGGAKDYRLVHISKYLHAVDEAVKKAIRNTTVPLVIMAVDYIQSTYKRLSRYPTIYQKAVTLNPDHLTESEIHKMTKRLFLPSAVTEEG